MINLDKIQSMWQEDCKIDIDNMHEESIKVPQLHSKYHEILNNLILLRTKAQKIQKSVRHERYEYYSGKADPDVYKRQVRLILIICMKNQLRFLNCIQNIMRY